MKSILSFLNDCELGKKQNCRNLTLFPVLHTNGVEPYYLTLEQAIESGLLTVTEVDDAGNVNRLKLTNKGSKPILLIEGEELRGAKQNRIVNASFLIAGKTTTTIPVSCVEERRWQYDSPKFSAGKKVMHASLRREAQSSMCDSLWRRPRRLADPGAEKRVPQSWAGHAPGYHRGAGIGGSKEKIGVLYGYDFYPAAVGGSRNPATLILTHSISTRDTPSSTDTRFVIPINILSYNPGRLSGY